MIDFGDERVARYVCSARTRQFVFGQTFKAFNSFLILAFIQRQDKHCCASEHSLSSILLSSNTVFVESI